jgi:hypothetical protein
VKRILLLTTILDLCCSIALAQGVDKSKPVGRACLGIVNTATGNEAVLRTGSTAGKNQKIVAHLDATVACEVLVSPFLKSGPLVPGWLPQYVVVSPEKETLLPKAPVSWSWEQNNSLLEIFVLFFPPGSKEGSEIRDLVNGMSKARSTRLFGMQTAKLRELIGSAHFDKEAALHAPKASSEVAGVMRMVVGFEWRDSARSVNFSSEKPGVLIFPAPDTR